MKSDGSGVLILAVIVALVVLSFGWTILQWFECRNMGHSILYCIGHILR